ncbi:MAG: xanthine dehydrogenase family protein molybdopterin-binding subunit [Rhizobiaceae bacterium]|nr:xanthine dehydrogenase family protein molybdopterin-binding subunit [Rhizobiaceae bacterium]
MSRLGTITRRTLLVGAAVVAGGAAFGYYSYRRPYENPLEADEGEAVFNPFVKIGADNSITVIAPRAEMGQGVSTTLAALVAEELDVELGAVRVEHGPTSWAYYNAGAMEESVPFAFYNDSAVAQFVRDSIGVVGRIAGVQSTGGSATIRDGYVRMRKAGAAARIMLTAAAAKRLGVPADEIGSANGILTHEVSRRSLTYGEVALDAASEEAPDDPPLRDRSQWRLLGKSQKRVDMMDKVTGAPIFGIDMRQPDMLFGTVRMSPRLGAKPVRSDVTKAEAVPGVVKVVPLDTSYGGGFGVIAENSWAAFRAADAIDVEWGDASYPSDSETIDRMLRDRLDEGGGSAFRDDGDIEGSFADAPADQVVAAEYSYPFLAHACMEPMNATARRKDGKLELWAPCQMPTITRWLCSGVAGIDQTDVTLTVTSMGGGFGRRLESDFAIYATLLAMEADGRPVNVTWTREADTRHGPFRPAARGRFRARLGDDGLPVAVDMDIAAPSVTRSFVHRGLPWVPMVMPDKITVDGAWDQPYTIPSYRVSALDADLGIPVASWRSVGASGNGFFHECFLDEIAAAGGVDPIELRRRLMADYPTAVGVVDKVAEMSGWGEQLPMGKAKGVAFTLAFGGWVAEVVQVADTPDGIRIEKVWAAADIGLALDPGIVEAQIVSGVIYGLSAAMGQEITFADGMVVQSNFHDFDAMRMHQCPEFEVAILENSPKMGGVGEIGTPPAAPALANAIFALTGKRLRDLPLSREVKFA